MSILSGLVIWLFIYSIPRIQSEPEKWLYSLIIISYLLTSLTGFIFLIILIIKYLHNITALYINNEEQKKKSDRESKRIRLLQDIKIFNQNPPPGESVPEKNLRLLIAYATAIRENVNISEDLHNELHIKIIQAIQDTAPKQP